MFKHQASLDVAMGTPVGDFGDVELPTGETRGKGYEGYSKGDLKDMGDKYQKLADDLAADIRAKGGDLTVALKTAEAALADEIEQLVSQLWETRKAKRASLAAFL